MSPVPSGVSRSSAGIVAAGSGSECAVSPRRIHGGVVPPCPSCGAPTEDQLRKPDGADRALWHCLICQRSRQPEPGWHDPLVPIGDVELRVRNSAMQARVRARWADDQW